MTFRVFCKEISARGSINEYLLAYGLGKISDLAVDNNRKVVYLFTGSYEDELTKINILSECAKYRYDFDVKVLDWSSLPHEITSVRCGLKADPDSEKRTIVFIEK